VIWHVLYSKVIIQGAFDAAVGTAAYWLFMRRSGMDEVLAEGRY
jgi:hypothetical protein